jgi:predicted nucleic acid-binding protein
LTGFLLDTNIVSEAIREQPSPAVMAWLERHAVHAFIPAMAVAEMQLGIELMPPGRRRLKLETWFLDLVQDAYADRILPFDTDSALAFGRIVARARRAGRPIPVADAQIAAVALVHNLTVATRDVADFAGFGVALVNPFEAA